MNDLSPCIVCYSTGDNPGSYTKVMTKRKAIETAEKLAIKGHRTTVYSLNFLSCYDGSHLSNGSV